MPQPDHVVRPGDQPPEGPQPQDEQPFQTPEEVSRQEQSPVADLASSEDPTRRLARAALHALPEHGTPDKKNKFKALLAWRPTKKQGIIIAVAAVLIIGGGVALALKLTHHSKPAPVVVKQAPKPAPQPPAPKPILSPLTGLPVTADQQSRPVTAVMIENSMDARPQSGLDQAGVVFEAIAEAGITRFMAIYQESNPAILGPVRSARPYFIDWLTPFDAGYAHVGGSPTALQLIKDRNVKNLDEFYNGAAYHRISTRYAPHNMYTSMANLNAVETAKGWTHSNIVGFKRKAKEEPMATPAAKSIGIGISSAWYNVHYDYDAATNSYLRSEGGSKHIDHETGKQLSPKVVIVMAVPYSHMSDNYHSQYQTIGTGKVLVFQDGNVAGGTWSKPSLQDQITFTGDNGKPILLNPGQTWITAVGDISDVTYQP